MSPLPPPAPRGRGAAANVDHRFTQLHRESTDDGWWQDADAAPNPATTLLPDRAKGLISHNDSPDLGFSQSVNPYRGCEHGCIYCYARPTHAWLGLSPGLDFETRLFYKDKAAALFRAELAKPGYVCSPLALGTATDAYQPVERRLGLTRQLLEVALDTGHPVSVVTKSALICRDRDLWQALAARNLAQVCISLTSLDPELSRRLEPRASAPRARLAAIANLADAGIPVSVLTAPVIPAVTDHHLEKLLEAAASRGARYAQYTLLRLPHEVADLFQDWLQRHVPDKAARCLALLTDLRQGKLYDARFGSRMTGLGPYADLIRQRFDLACRRLGLKKEWPQLDCGQFIKPAGARPPSDTRQLDLF